MILSCTLRFGILLCPRMSAYPTSKVFLERLSATSAGRKAIGILHAGHWKESRPKLITGETWASTHADMKAIVEEMDSLAILGRRNLGKVTFMAIASALEYDLKAHPLRDTLTSFGVLEKRRCRHCGHALPEMNKIATPKK